MKSFVLLTALGFASKNENDVESFAENSGEKIVENGEQNLKLNFLDENTEVCLEKKTSDYIGVSYSEKQKKWVATRWSNTEKKCFNNGYHKDEETAAHASDTLARSVMANGTQSLKLNFPDENTEVHAKRRSSKYFGVSYNEKRKIWAVQRWSKSEKKIFKSGYYKDEETAAHASDAVARKLMANGEGHKLNFPGENTEVYPESKKSSKYFGVTYNNKTKQWVAQKWSKTEKKTVNNGYHKDEETAARAGDTLARKLMENGEQNIKLNFPDEKTEVHPTEKTKISKYIGVTYNERTKRWIAQRYGKMEKRSFSNGTYNDEESAAHASDTLARKLIANGEHHKVNFPDEQLEYQSNKRKRPIDFENSQTDRTHPETFEEKED